MQINFDTYIPRDSVVHEADARLKIAVLFVYSVALLAVPAWWGVLLLAVVFVAALAASRLPVERILGPVMIPAYLLAAISLTCNLLPSAGGLLAGALAAARIVLLVAASLIVSYSTTPVQVMDALKWFLGPLGRIGVPVNDVSMALSLSLRFIPVTADEFCAVYNAQAARGASFARGGLWARLKAWASIFVSLFVRLFRRADNLAAAMESRCYGAPHDKI